MRKPQTGHLYTSLHAITRVKVTNRLALLLSSWGELMTFPPELIAGVFVSDADGMRLDVDKFSRERNVKCKHFPRGRFAYFTRHVSLASRLVARSLKCDSSLSLERFAQVYLLCCSS